ncbi:Alcohol dehydrogenase, variant 2 [Balamuthia mandrillaris]
MLDVHVWEDGYSLGERRGMWRFSSRGLHYPLTPGHEISGVIERVGEKVTTVQPGDKVVVYPWIGCGSCSRCRQGHDNICDGHTREIGFSNRGGYAQQVWVPHERYVVKLPEGMPLESSCLLPCSGLTAFSALKRTNVSAKDFILFIGMGGVGMMALKLAKLLLHSPIICVDIDDKKLEAAKEAGATFVFNSKTNTELEKDIRSLCNDGKGPECIIDFVGAPSTIDLAVSVLRKNGKLLVVGLLGGEAQIPIPFVPLRALTIQGVHTGSYEELVELVALLSRHQHSFRPLITRKYDSLSSATTALEELRGGSIVGRAILCPNRHLGELKAEVEKEEEELSL